MYKMYFSIFLNGIKSKVIYKTSYILSILSPFIRVYIYYLIWSRILVNSQQSKYTKEGILIYLIMGGILSLIFSPSSLFIIASKIKSGTLPYLILKPFNVIGNLFVEYMASASIFIMILFFWLLITKNFIGLIYLVISFILYFFIIITIGNTAFYMLNIWPFRPLLSALILIFGGTVYPLDFLPEKFYSIMQYNPLSIIFYQNIKIISGNKPTGILFLFLILWTVFFFIISKVTFKNGLKKYEGLGL